MAEETASEPGAPDGRREQWEQSTLRKALDHLGLEVSPHDYYGPEDIAGFDFYEKVGFAGSYPFTSTLYAAQFLGTEPKGDSADPRMARAGRLFGLRDGRGTSGSTPGDARSVRSDRRSEHRLGPAEPAGLGFRRSASAR